MRQKGFSLLIVVIIVTLAIVGVVIYLNKNLKYQQSLVTSPSSLLNSVTKVEDPNWKTYSSDKYNFQFFYPSESEISTRDDTQYQYIRFENDHPNKELYSSLREDEFYLEVFIFDHKLNNYMNSSCGTKVNEIYISRKELEGDTGGSGKYSLCVNTNEFDILIDGTEGKVDAPIVNKIFSSFKFKSK